MRGRTRRVSAKALTLASVLGLLFSSIRADVQPPATPSFLDRELIAAIAAENATTAERVLDAGADPNATIGEPEDGHALCAATEPGREALLELLLRHGADVDRLYGDNHFFGSPLNCAISNGNLVAFERLIEEGASPGLDVCLFCEPHRNYGPFEAALNSEEFEMAWRLVELGAVGPRERGSLRFSLQETNPFDKVDDPHRLKLIDWLRAQGVYVLPREENPCRSRWYPPMLPPSPHTKKYLC